MATPFALTPKHRAALDALVTDLERVFAARLDSVVAYGVSSDGDDRPVHGLALVESLTFDDLRNLVPLVDTWGKHGLAVPLILGRQEFLRTLDVFPLEYGNIIANHVVLKGSTPFAGASVSDVDRRRGCEREAKSHLIHLREGFLEAGGDARSVYRLIAASSPAFRTVLANIIRLERGDGRQLLFEDDEELAKEAFEVIGIDSAVVSEVLSSPRGATAAADPSALLARYIEVSERLWRFVDGWQSRP